MFGLHKLYSKQSLLRFLWKKVHRLEKSTPTPLVALQTKGRLHKKITGLFGNFSQMAGPPPHPPLLGTPRSK